jgi:hypothetical protein
MSCLSFLSFASQWEFQNRCKAWIENTMVTFGVRWKCPTLKTLLAWAFKMLNAWTMFGAKTTLVLCLFDPVFIMKSIKAMIHPKFLLPAKLSHLLRPAKLLVRFVVSPPCVYKLVYATCIMWFICCQICQK